MRWEKVVPDSIGWVLVHRSYMGWAGGRDAERVHAKGRCAGASLWSEGAILIPGTDGPKTGGCPACPKLAVTGPGGTPVGSS